MSLPGLGPLESAVMEVMWRAREPITGRTCLNRLDYQTGTIAGRPPNPGRSFAIGYILRHLGQRPNGSSNANYLPSRD